MLAPAVPGLYLLVMTAETDTDPAQEKARLRKEAFARRKAAHASLREGAGTAVAHILAREPAFQSAAIVAGYCPIRTEIDPTPAMAAVVARGGQVCVPEIVAAGQPLIFRAWWPGVAMRDGPFGAAVPDGTDTLVPDFVIVPLVAFTALGGRLGYGGGFYDRTLEGLRACAPTVAVGLAYGAQETSTLPHDPNDQPLDAIVTENGIIRPEISP